MPKPITDMKKASSSESSYSSPPSESSEDEGEGMTLAQLTRQKAAPVNEDVGSATSVLSGENEEEDNEEEDKEEEYDEEELQEPRDLEEVLQDEVLPSKLKDVWMSGKINKYVDEEDGLRKWTCGFCGEVRKGWNATKALGHMIGGASNVKGCEKITSEWMQLYLDIVKRKTLSKRAKGDHLHQLNMSLDNKEADALLFARADKAASQLRRFSGPVHASLPTNSVDVTASVEDISTLTSGIINSNKKPATKNFFQKGNSTGELLCVFALPIFKALTLSLKHSTPSDSKWKQKVYVQQNIVMSTRASPQAEEELHIAIAHWIAAHCLPFSMSEDALFMRILAKARATNHKYVPPTRYQVAGRLLDANFAAYQKDSLDSLLADVDTYGVSIFGDGATIVKTPMINILASSPTNPSCVLDVVDCSNHMLTAGKKDAWYIAKQILPIMRNIDPNKNRIHVVAFDGAYNVQKAGELLREHYPQITVLQGIEHTVATIIGKWVGLRPIKTLCQFAKTVRTLLFLSFNL
jgi:hypothetical protein